MNLYSLTVNIHIHFRAQRVKKGMLPVVRDPCLVVFRRSVSNPADEGAPGPTGAAAQQFGWSRTGAHRQHADTVRRRPAVMV